ncbi:SRPBCC family protein [Chloroflexota bacterium]
MATIKKSIKINAPVEKVFEYVAKPEILPEIWPSLVEVKNIKELPNGGYSWDWVYKMSGMRFTGFSESTEVVPNVRTVSQTTGGIESTITWEYQPVDDGTKITNTTEYKVPIPLLGKLAESIIVKMNENEADVILANLKARMET